MFKNIVK